MSGIIQAVQKLRDLRKKEARLSFLSAEQEMLAQKKTVTELNELARKARQVAVEDDAGWIAHRHSWSLQLELRRRTEMATLSEHQKTTEHLRTVLEVARRDAGVIERYSELKDERAQVDEKRREAKVNDGIGTQQWWRQCG